MIVWRSTSFSTLFQLYLGGKSTYPCFPGVLLTSTLTEEALENIVEIEENACNQHFASFSIMFSNLFRDKFHRLTQIRFRHEQFLPFPPCFQKTCAADTCKKKQALFGKGLNSLTLSQTISTPRKTALKNIVGKGENAGNIFSFSHNVLYTSRNNFHFFFRTFILSSENAFNL